MLSLFLSVVLIAIINQDLYNIDKTFCVKYHIAITLITVTLFIFIRILIHGYANGIEGIGETQLWVD